MAPETRATAGRIEQLDLQAAVIRHLEWCVAFNDHLGHINQGESLPVRRLPGAEQSELGQWLQRSASRAPGEHPAHTDLERSRARVMALLREMQRS